MAQAAATRFATAWSATQNIRVAPRSNFTGMRRNLRPDEQKGRESKSHPPPAQASSAANNPSSSALDPAISTLCWRTGRLGKILASLDLEAPSWLAAYAGSMPSMDGAGRSHLQARLSISLQEPAGTFVQALNAPPVPAFCTRVYSRDKTHGVRSRSSPPSSPLQATAARWHP